MTDNKIKAVHRQRAALVYIRQSTASQVEHNRESTARQYALVDRACDLGWAKEQVKVIDEDLAITGSIVGNRAGFERMAWEVGLGRVGIILGIEVSRLARNNANWYRLLDLCAITDTLIGDNDGLYHPALFNDRLVLGLKGTMSEAELHIIRARLDGGIRNKAQRGELRRELPVGLVWGEKDGEVRFHPDEAIVGAIRTVFDRFAEIGSVRQVWLWFRSQGLPFPSQVDAWGAEIRWIAPTYRSIHQVLTNPVYAGAYVYGRNHSEQYIDEQGAVRKRSRRLPMKEWRVLIHDHHVGFLDWPTFQANQERIRSNTRAERQQSGGAVREGSALLQGIATCGHCGRGLFTYYRGDKATPGYRCSANDLGDGGHYCFQVGAVGIDKAVADAFLDAITPAAVEASLLALEQLEADRDAVLRQWRLEVERARYEAERAERRYRVVEPEHRLVARGLETEWENRLRDLAAAENELRRREQHHARRPRPDEIERLRTLGVDLRQVWTAPTTTDRDRKELLRTLLEEVIISIAKTPPHAQVRLRWKGGAMTPLEIPLPHHAPPGLHTDEDTIELLARLAKLYPDDVIAGILTRQGRKTATGQRFTAGHVGNLRRYHKIDRYQSQADVSEGELVTVQKAAEILGVVPSTLHRWLNTGFIAGEQITPGAPWRIRMTEELRARFVEQAPPGYLPMIDARRKLGVSRQTVLQRVKRGELQAIYVRCGRRKGLRIKVVEAQPNLFQQTSLTGVQYET